MKIVVTGGAGFIGSHLVDRLLHAGNAEVVVLDNLLRGRVAHLAQHSTNSALRIVEGDIREPALLHELFAGADTIYHLAAQSNVIGAVSDLNYSFSTNVAGTVHVLQAAQQANVRRVVFTSSREVYGEVVQLPVREETPLNAKNAYGASKAAGELYARVFQTTYGLETSVLRLANVYGPRDRDRVIPLWLDAARAGRNLIVYGGTQLIDFIYIDTVVEALIRAATRPLWGPLNIGSGQGTPILALAERILALDGVDVQIDRQPAREIEVARFTANVAAMYEYLDLEPPDDPLFALEQLWALPDS